MITKKVLQDTIDDAIAELMGSLVKVVATKDDLKDFVTKDDLKNLATKDDLKEVKDELKFDIKEIRRQINDLKADVPTPQEYRDHDKRITKLETAVFPTP